MRNLYFGSDRKNAVDFVNSLLAAEPTLFIALNGKNGEVKYDEGTYYKTLKVSFATFHTMNTHPTETHHRRIGSHTPAEKL